MARCTTLKFTSASRRIRFALAKRIWPPPIADGAQAKVARKKGDDPEGSSPFASERHRDASDDHQILSSGSASSAENAGDREQDEPRQHDRWLAARGLRKTTASVVLRCAPHRLVPCLD